MSVSVESVDAGSNEILNLRIAFRENNQKLTTEQLCLMGSAAREPAYPSQCVDWAEKEGTPLIHELARRLAESEAERKSYPALVPGEAAAFGCHGTTIKLFSGAYFDFANPDPSIIKINDIAEVLSKICRFGGHCRGFYSVAEHSVYTARLAMEDGCPVDEMLAVLFHDATETYVGDMVKPLKILLSEYSKIEAAVEWAISAALNIDFEKHKSVIKKYDRMMLIHERRRLFDGDNVLWPGEEEVGEVDIEIQHLPPMFARSLFWQEYKLIIGS